MGSEMCIRDRLWSLQQGIFRDKKRAEKSAPVSAAKVVEDEDDGESITY